MDERLQELTRAVERDPRDPGAVCALSTALVRLDRAADARRALAGALQAGAPGAQLVGALREAGSPLRVLPLEDRQALVAAAGGALHVVARFESVSRGRAIATDERLLGLAPSAEALEDARHAATTGERRGYAPERFDPWRRPSGDEVLAVRLADGLPPLPGAPFRLPRGLVGVALHVVDDVLFVGGLRDEEPRAQLVVFRDLREPASDWGCLSFPERACGHGKAVDAFVQLGTRLIAVDDFVLPKWLFVIDVTDPRAPRLRKAKQLRAHTTYESVLAASASAEVVALLSGGVNHGHKSQHLSLLDPETLKERVHAYHAGGNAFLDSSGPGDEWCDVLVSGDHVAVAAGCDGVRVLELASDVPEELPDAALRPARGLDLAEGEAAVRLVALDERFAAVAIADAAGVVRRHAAFALV